MPLRTASVCANQSAGGKVGGGKHGGRSSGTTRKWRTGRLGLRLRSALRKLWGKAVGLLRRRRRSPRLRAKRGPGLTADRAAEAAPQRADADAAPSRGEAVSWSSCTAEPEATGQQRRSSGGGASSGSTAPPESIGRSLDEAWHFGVLYPGLLRAEQALTGPKEQQTVGSEARREDIVERLIHLHVRYMTRPETIYLAVKLIDKYLEHVCAQPAPAQPTGLSHGLLGAAAFVIAMKFEEGESPDFAHLVKEMGDEFGTEQLHSMEVVLLGMLGYRLHVPAAVHHLRWFLEVARASPEQCAIAEYVCEVGLASRDFPTWRPSEHAAAAVVLSGRIRGAPEWPARFAALCGAAGSDSKRRGILRVTSALRRAVRQVAEGHPVYDKFASERHSKIACKIAEHAAEACATQQQDRQHKRRRVWRRRALHPAGSSVSVLPVGAEAPTGGSHDHLWESLGCNPESGWQQASVPCGHDVRGVLKSLIHDDVGVAGQSDEKRSDAPPRSEAAASGTQLLAAPQDGCDKVAPAEPSESVQRYFAMGSSTEEACPEEPEGAAEQPNTEEIMQLLADSPWRPAAPAGPPTAAPIMDWTDADRSWYEEVLHPDLSHGEEAVQRARSICQSAAFWRSSREFVVGWVIRLHTTYLLCPETLYLAVNLVDRYLAHLQARPGDYNGKLRRMMLLGSALLCIAAKFQDSGVPEFQSLVDLASGNFNLEELGVAEVCLLATLNFSLHQPLAVHFLPYILDLAGAGLQQRAAAEYICQVGLTLPQLPQWRASDHAAAAVELAMLLMGGFVWTPALRVHCGIDDEARFETVGEIFATLVEALVQQDEGDPLHDKFSAESNGFLAQKLVVSLAEVFGALPP